MLYYMQELKAPAGYMLDDTKYWFCFCGDVDTNCTECNDIIASTDAYRIPFDEVGKIHISNEIMDYDLPATGSAGTKPLLLVSVTLIVIPLVYGFILRRKRGRRVVG